jgi:hypothetical protein
VNFKDTVKAWLFSLCLLAMLGAIVIAGKPMTKSAGMSAENKAELLNK